MNLQRDEPTVGVSSPRGRVGHWERSKEMGGRPHRRPLRARRARRILSAKGTLASTLVSLLACVACGRSPSPRPEPAAQVVARIPDASVDALAPDARVGADSLLHVAVTHAVVREDAQMSPWLRVCPVQGAVFLCGESAVYVQRDGVVARDTTLEAGLAHDSTGLFNLIAVYGRWPDNAWLVATDVSQPPPFETTNVPMDRKSLEGGRPGPQVHALLRSRTVGGDRSSSGRGSF